MKKVKDFAPELAAYIEGVQSGEIVASRMVRFAVDRHVSDVEKSATEDFAFWFDMRQANAMLTVMGLFRVPDGLYASKPMNPFDFQVFILAMIFGWREKAVIEVDGVEHNLRRFKEAFLSMARGNTKTPLSAVISIYQLVFDVPYFPGAECFLTATKREQAQKPLKFAKQLIASVPELSDFLVSGAHAIIFENQFSFLQTLSSEGKSADSTTTQSVIRDELHAWTKKDREYYGKLSTSLGKRPQSLAVTTTTAGNDQSVIWKEDDSYARKVVDPNIDFTDEELFVFIAEIDECEVDVENLEPEELENNPDVFKSDDIFDEAVWPKANPALKYGVVRIGHLRREAKKARLSSSVEKSFRRFHCNRLASSKFKMFTPKQWAIGHAQTYKYDRRTPSVIGIDIGFKDDLAALACLGITGFTKVKAKNDKGEEVEEQRKNFNLEVDVWIPEEGDRDILSNPWPRWIEAGWVRKCPGPEVRISYMKARFRELATQRKIVAVYADPWSCREFLQWIEDEFPSIKTVEFGQTHRSYHEPTQEFISANNDGLIAHANPVLDWCASNAVGVANADGYKKPSKDHSEDKIDPFQASIMAFAGGLYEKIKPRKTAYQSRGFLLAGSDGIEIID